MKRMIEVVTIRKDGRFNLLDYDIFAENVIGIAEEVYKNLYK